MDNSLLTTKFKIPEYESVESRLKCYNCTFSCDRNCHIDSRYNCEKFVRRISIVKLIIEIIIFNAITVFSLINFNGFWPAILKVTFTFILLLASDFLTDKMIKNICISSEKLRKAKYDAKVQKLKENNEAIKRAKAGITEEIQEFLDNSKSLYNELHRTFESINKILNMEAKDSKRVINKFKEVLNELDILNGKLSDNNFESTYITTLYEIHLPKLLEYSNQFVTYLNSNTLTQKQITEFANLLEVFRVKISKHAEYLQNKIEDDFIIKMRALNEDVIPDFDGSEVKNNE